VIGSSTVEPRSGRPAPPCRGPAAPVAFQSGTCLPTGRRRQQWS
jgi:hypothetical protein